MVRSIKGISFLYNEKIGYLEIIEEKDGISEISFLGNTNIEERKKLYTTKLSLVLTTTSLNAPLLWFLPAGCVVLSLALTKLKPSLVWLACVTNSNLRISMKPRVAHRVTVEL